MKVIVASTNPVKINAGRGAVAAMFPDMPFTCTGVGAVSGVPEQPMGSDETLRGARNRVAHARELAPDADYWIAFEGGLEEHDDGGLRSVIWVCIQDTRGIISDSRCATFVVPPEIARLVRSGLTLGEADDKFFKRTNSKQQNGAIGLLTHDALTRESVYMQGAILALIPFRNREWYAAAAQAA